MRIATQTKYQQFKDLTLNFKLLKQEELAKRDLISKKHIVLQKSSAE